MATLTAPAGSFRGRGTVTVRATRAALPYGRSLTAAGPGLDVTFAGVTLARPVIIRFDVTHAAGPGDVAVVAHRLATGSWELERARLAGRQMTVHADSFSVHIPAWLNPKAWLHWLGSRLASAIGGRTPPIDCAAGPLAWASLSGRSDEAHTCLISNVAQASHVTRAELQIKSNRGYALEVDIPPGADYTWVQSQPWPVRAAVWAHLIHRDPNLMALLPAGATMTAGYQRPYASESLPFQVRVTYWSLGYSLIGDIVDALSGQAADNSAAVIATLYLIGKCSGAVDYKSLSVRDPLSTATFGSALTCVISQAAANLSSPRKALSAARSLLGRGIDNLDLTSAASSLTAVGSRLLTFGWVVTLWPALQLGWGGTADVIHSLLTGGTSTQITLNLRSGQPTQKVDVSPLNDHYQIAAGYQITRQVSGANCLPGSEAIGAAYRCFAGNGIYDPCWEGISNTHVSCLTLPWSHDITELQVNQLPGLSGVSPASAGEPWGLQLANGKDCIIEQGAHDVFDGRAVDYSCGPSEVILRGLNITGAQWSAQTANYDNGTYTLGPRASITIAWYGKPDFGLAGP